MVPEHARVAFRMMEMDFEWNGATSHLKLKTGDAAPALLELIHSVITDSSGPGIPAITAVEKASRRLAQKVTDLRMISE